MRRSVLALAVAASAAGLVSTALDARVVAPDAQPAATPPTCDPAALRPESYRLTIDAQALNLTKPPYRWWDNYDIGRSVKDVENLNDAAIAIAERARALDDGNLLAHAQLARHYVAGAIDARRAHEEWRRTLDAGGAITWTATLPDVDVNSYFLLAFDRAGIRIYRFGQLAGAVKSRDGVPQFPGPDREELWRALGGCIADSLPAEATVPWNAVQELHAGNLTLSFVLNRPVTIISDRRRRREDDSITVALHGAAADVDRRRFRYGPMSWPIPAAAPPIEPAAFQERVRGTLIEMFDAEGRIKLPKQRRGFGW